MSGQVMPDDGPRQRRDENSLRCAPWAHRQSRCCPLVLSPPPPVLPPPHPPDPRCPPAPACCSPLHAAPSTPPPPRQGDQLVGGCHRGGLARAVPAVWPHQPRVPGSGPRDGREQGLRIRQLPPQARARGGGGGGAAWLAHGLLRCGPGGLQWLRLGCCPRLPRRHDCLHAPLQGGCSARDEHPERLRLRQSDSARGVGGAAGGAQLDGGATRRGGGRRPAAQHAWALQRCSRLSAAAQACLGSCWLLRSAVAGRHAGSRLEVPCVVVAVDSAHA